MSNKDSRKAKLSELGFMNFVVCIHLTYFVLNTLFFRVLTWFFCWFISMTPNFFQAATLKKIWVEATVKKPQVAPYKNLGRFYRVPFKSLLRVQVKLFSRLKNSDMNRKKTFGCSKRLSHVSHPKWLVLDIRPVSY